MDNIHAGWLTKSPRQRKTSTLWKLFRSVSRFLVSPVSLAPWFRFSHPSVFMLIRCSFFSWHLIVNGKAVMLNYAGDYGEYCRYSRTENVAQFETDSTVITAS